ncbi:MAG: beta-galactosidase [Pseudomonadota bacterium]
MIQSIVLTEGNLERNGRMRLGVCYYPEHWDQGLWADDAKRMVDLGLEVVRLGEFAWSRIEPASNEFDWGWLDKAIETLSDVGLQLILGTPTATPPKWLIDTYPDILAWDKDRRPRRFGSRRHYCFSSPRYTDETRRIVTAMTKRYGDHSAVEAWQTDNEYGCHDTVRSYSPAAEVAFQNWLANRYRDIDKLNDAWGTVFWSQVYQSFDQIDIPNLTTTEPNPSHVLDFYRFSSDQVVTYNRMQTTIIRANSPGREIYHNFMGFFTDFDHYQLSEDIDIAGWDSYPLGFLDIGPYDMAEKLAFMRQGHPDFAAFHHDLYRNCGRGRFAVLEQQPGPVNWADHNPAPFPGMLRLWTHEAAAHGAELLCYFRWRQAPFAQEQMHAGLMRPDNEPAVGAAEVRQAAQEREGLKAAQAETPKASPPRIALVFSYETQWMSEIQPQGATWNYMKLVMHWYSVARSFGFDIDIVPPGAKLEDYALVIVPSLFNIPPPAIEAFSDARAPVIFGPRCGSKTQEMQVPPPLAPGPLQELIPVRVTHVESFPSNHLEAADFKGQPVTAGVWLDHLESDLSPIVRSVSGHDLLYHHENIWLFTSQPDAMFLRLTIEAALEPTVPNPEQLPGALRTRTSGAIRYAFNYADEDCDGLSVLIKEDGLFDLGTAHLKPADLACWRT